MALAQHQEAVAVGQGFAVGAAGGQDAEPFRAGFAREHVAQFIGRLGRILGEEHAVAARRFRELARRDLGQVRALLEAFVVFADLAIGPGRGHQRQAGHRDGHRNGDAQHRLEPVRQRQAAGEPDHHLGFPVVARDRGEHRDEDRDGQDGRQRRDGGQRGQHEHDVRPDVAARRLTEQAHQQHAEPYDEQRGKDNASVTGDLADDRARTRETLMEFSTQTTASLHQIKTAALAVGVFADGVLSPAADLIDRAANGAVRAVTKTEFRGRAGSTLVLRSLPGVSAQRVVLVGLGKQDEYSARAHASAEQAFAAACVSAQLTEGVSTLAANPIADVALIARARSAAIAAGSATYHYDASFGKPDRDARPKLKKIVQIVERADAAQAQKGLREGAAIANGMELTRTLGNLPGNICTPTYLGDTAKRLAREYKSLKVEVMDRKQVEALGMGSFLSVARGSEEALRFIVLRHAGKPAKKGAKAPPPPWTK
ncbi:putative cytosol aminopeptidase [Beauveria bassiana D1-5]|uniref:Putative cytosol aminopeptidase n=1 Tax=Beauveria bassiana D1-5 TaxID=1245745 RepID=A0A0A2V8D9_BEABA|nr:putative cytosol aminopeptidase [Beauveria bassiana D1-5]